MVKYLQILLVVGVLASVGFAKKLPKKEQSPIHKCSAFCYHQNKNGGLARETVEATDSALESAWKDLNQQCSDLGVKSGKHELQKSRSTAKEPGDDFTEATKENSCATTSTSKEK